MYVALDPHTAAFRQDGHLHLRCQMHWTACAAFAVIRLSTPTMSRWLVICCKGRCIEQLR